MTGLTYSFYKNFRYRIVEILKWILWKYLCQKWDLTHRHVEKHRWNFYFCFIFLCGMKFFFAVTLLNMSGLGIEMTSFFLFLII